jgi:citrate lyase subunit beta / citryl-CoA lyase
MPDQPPSRRSCLSLPGSSAKMLGKAPTLPADELIVDLEDAVVPAAKDEARALVVESLGAPEFEGKQVSVRVNAPRSPWCHLDVAAIGASPGAARALVIPKVESAGDLAFVDRLLDGVEAAAGGGVGLRTQALIENAAGLANVGEIAASSPRLDSLIVGYADLKASLGRSGAGAADLDSWRAIQDAVLVAARANGLQAIDGPFLGVKVEPEFEAAVARARDLGFDGKWAIHPSQLEHLNAAFSPSAEEVEWARKVIATMEEAERDGGRGAVALDGEMLDEAVTAAARRILARA